VLGPHRVAPGDVVVAMASSGLHSNGYSLVRHVLLERGGLELGEARPEFGGRTLADELLIPTRVYARDCLALVAQCEVHAFAHITGGGLAGNLARVLPPGATAHLDRATWAPGPVFDLVARTGGVGRAQMELTFNLGVGMVAVLPSAMADDAVTVLAERAVPAWVVGEVRFDGGGAQPGPGAGSVELVGSYPGPSATWELAPRGPAT
jgi:phosphoribosylformylglycinamidine cyclo-ligase